MKEGEGHKCHSECILEYELQDGRHIGEKTFTAIAVD
jgi:hypothetical protein